MSISCDSYSNCFLKAKRSRDCTFCFNVIASSVNQTNTSNFFFSLIGEYMEGLDSPTNQISWLLYIQWFTADYNPSGHPPHEHVFCMLLTGRQTVFTRTHHQHSATLYLLYDEHKESPCAGLEEKKFHSL